MLSNAYFLAKFRFDTAENGPAKNLQKLKFANFPNSANPNPTPRCRRTESAGLTVRGLPARPKPAVGVRPEGGKPEGGKPESGKPAGGKPKLKGSIGEEPNHSNFSDRSSVRILSKFRNFR